MHSMSRQDGTRRTFERDGATRDTARCERIKLDRDSAARDTAHCERFNFERDSAARDIAHWERVKLDEPVLHGKQLFVSG